MRFLNLLAKRHHFGRVGGLDPDIISGLNIIVSAFTGKNRERQTKLSQASSLNLWELITDGRLESNARTLLRKPNFLFVDSINEDAEVMLYDSYKWLCQLEECRFFLSDMERMFSFSSIQLMSLPRSMECDLTEEQFGVSLGWISHHNRSPGGSWQECSRTAAGFVKGGVSRG